MSETVTNNDLWEEREIEAKIALLADAVGDTCAETEDVDMTKLTSLEKQFLLGLLREKLELPVLFESTVFHSGPVQPNG